MRLARQAPSCRVLHESVSPVALTMMCKGSIATGPTSTRTTPLAVRPTRTVTMTQAPETEAPITSTPRARLAARESSSARDSGCKKPTARAWPEAWVCEWRGWRGSVM